MLTQSWRSKSAVFRMYSSLTSHGYSKSTKAVRRQRNLGLAHPVHQKVSRFFGPITCNKSFSPRFLCRLFWTCCSRGTPESYAYGKQRSCLTNSWSAHFHVLWLSDFIFYRKPLYKSLHQSFFYSFITILPSESGVALHSSTSVP